MKEEFRLGCFGCFGFSAWRENLAGGCRGRDQFL